MRTEAGHMAKPVLGELAPASTDLDSATEEAPGVEQARQLVTRPNRRQVREALELSEPPGVCRLPGAPRRVMAARSSSNDSRTSVGLRDPA